MIVPGLQRVFDSLDSFGLTVDNDGVITGVLAPFASPNDSPAAAAGITPGDRVDLKSMRCIPADINTLQCASLLALLGGLGETQAALPHSQITLTLQAKSGAPPHTIILHSAPAPLTSAERLVLFADTVVGIVVIIIAFWLVWTRPSWMTWGLFFYVLWFNPGQSYAYYALLQRSPAAILVQEIAESLAQGAAFAGLLLFALRFPEDRTEPRWRKLRWAVPLLAAVITALTLANFASIFGFPTERITEVTFLAGFAIDAAVLFILLARRRALARLHRTSLSSQRRPRLLRVASGLVAPCGQRFHSPPPRHNLGRAKPRSRHSYRPAARKARAPGGRRSLAFVDLGARRRAHRVARTAAPARDRRGTARSHLQSPIPLRA